MNLVELQVNRLTSCLDKCEGDWKVLIYDVAGKNIIAPLLKVGALRALGVTLWLGVDDTRSQIQGVHVIYFVEYNESNVAKVCSDLKQRLYTQCSLLFINSVSPENIKSLANTLVEAGCHQAVHSVQALHTKFVALEEDLFTLQIPHSYVHFNNETISEQVATKYLDDIVEGLLGVFLTLQSVPVLRCPTDSPVAAAVCRQLTERIRGALESGAWPSGAARGHRAVALIADRNLDFTGMLHHSWTYQALLQDILGLQDNKLVVSSQDEHGATQKLACDLDSAQDPLWRDWRTLGWPEIGPAVKNATTAWQADMSAMGGLELSDADSGSRLLDKSAGLGDAVSRLGEMTERKRVLDLHTNASHSVSKALGVRGFAEFFRLERELLQERQVDARDVQVAVGAGQPGTPEDKLRLALIWMLTGDREKDALEGVQRALSAAGCDMQAFQLIKSRGLSAAQHEPESVKRTASIVSRGWSALSSTSSSVQGIMKKYSHGEAECLKLTAVAEELMENKKGSAEVDNYMYFDPRSASASPPRSKTEFTQGMVFVIGGGNYFEYQNVTTRFKNGRQVIYGSTEIISPAKFCGQLGELARIGEKK